MPLSADNLAYVRDIVYRRSAIVLDKNKDYLIQARLDQVAVETGVGTADDMVVAAKRGELRVLSNLVEALTTNETFFFRDTMPFDCVRLQVLPALIKSREQTRSLTIWSAACSTGQEAYSLAMLIREHFPILAGWSVRILATDLSEQVIRRARAGVFNQFEVSRGLPPTLLAKYFDLSGTQFQIKSEIRNMVTFSQKNLLDEMSLSRKPDIVFMRNVLIYFDLGTKKSILARVRQLIAPDGALFLGAAETTMNIDDQWERVAYDKTAYYRIRR